MVTAGSALAFGLAELGPHVDLARLQPDGVMDDAVHDRIGMDPSAQPGVPVLLLVLGAEDRGLAVAPQFHELHDHAPEVVVGLVQQPLVQHKDLEAAVFPDGLPRRPGTQLGGPPFLLQVRDPDGLATLL